MVDGAIAHSAATPEPGVKVSLHAQRSSSIKQALVMRNFVRWTSSCPQSIQRLSCLYIGQKKHHLQAVFTGCAANLKHTAL